MVIIYYVVQKARWKPVTLIGIGVLVAIACGIMFVLYLLLRFVGMSPFP